MRRNHPDLAISAGHLLREASSECGYGIRMTAFSYPPRWIDSHSHIFSGDERVLELIERAHVKINLICIGFGNDQELERQHSLASGLAAKAPLRYGWTAGWPWARFETPEYVSAAVTIVRRAHERGAVGVKVWKDIGLAARRQNGQFVQIDDPVFQPVLDELARNSIPLLAHLGDPLAAWLPLQPGDPSFEYYRSHPEWHLYSRPVPTYTEVLAARDRMMTRNPALTVVACHFASIDHDLVALGALLDRYPSLAIDTAERLGQMMLLDRDEVRSFFIRYQDRILYGSDLVFNLFDDDRTDVEALVKRAESVWQSELTWLSSAQHVTTRQGSGRGLALPDVVLGKILMSNAERWLPRLSTSYELKP